MARNKRIVRDLMLGAIALLMLVYCVQHQRVHYADWHQRSGKYVQKANLPHPEIIKVLSFRYRNLYADFLTLRAIQMFGAAWETITKETGPIYDYFDILTTLDPHFIDVYELGHLVLADDHRDYDLGLDLVRKGIRYNRTEWRLPYLGLYTTLWDMQDPDAAREFFLALRTVPDPPEHVLRLEEYQARQAGRYPIAFDINLQHLLRYRALGMHVEEQITFSKFRTILLGWYNIELADSADQFLREQGRPPLYVHELLQHESTIPRFTAPTMDSLITELDYWIELGEDLESHRDEIRDRSQIEIVGLPPDPYGYWIYIDRSRQRELASLLDDPDARPLDRHDYFVSVFDAMDQVNLRAVGGQERVMAKRNESNTNPTWMEMADLLTDDGLGGHFVYKPSPTRFFSTTTMRMLYGGEPRIGLQGTLDRFPRREFVVSENQTPFLQAEPDIWDHPEDAEWAYCRGFEPGVPLADHDIYALVAAYDPTKDFSSCDEHIPVPDPDQP